MEGACDLAALIGIPEHDHGKLDAIVTPEHKTRNRKVLVFAFVTWSAVEKFEQRSVYSSRQNFGAL